MVYLRKMREGGGDERYVEGREGHEDYLIPSHYTGWIIGIPFIADRKTANSHNQSTLKQPQKNQKSNEKQIPTQLLFFVG